MIFFDLLKRFGIEFKKTGFTILEDNSDKSRSECYLLILIIERQITFFQFHYNYKEACKSFELLTGGHWYDLKKNNVLGNILLLDYRKVELLRERNIVYKDARKNKSPC